MNRRLAIQLAPVLALAACAPTTGTTPTTSVQQVFNAIQYLLPVEQVLAVGLSVAVPQAAGLIAAVQPWLDKAAPAFSQLQATMTAAQGQPLVTQIEGYAKSAMDLIVAQVQNATPGSKLASFQGPVLEAQAALAVVTAFVTGVSAMPTAAMAPLPALLHR